MNTREYLHEAIKLKKAENKARAIRHEQYRLQNRPRNHGVRNRLQNLRTNYENKLNDINKIRRRIITRFGSFVTIKSSPPNVLRNAAARSLQKYAKSATLRRSAAKIASVRKAVPINSVVRKIIMGNRH